jgi:integrase
MTIGNVTRGRNNGKDVFIAQVSYTDENGRRRFIRGVGMTERQAMQRRQANIAKRLASPPVRDSAPALTVCDVFTRWIDSYGPNDISTEVRRKHRRQGELHILPFLADVPIADLDRERAQRYLSHDSAALPDGAWRNTYKVVKTMLTWATNTDLIPRNPITGVKQRTYKAAVHDDDIQLIDKRTTIALDLLRWLKDEQHKHYVLILFMFLGLRRSELLGLTWKCIDDDDEEVGARIHVRQQLARAKGQGWFIDPRTKNNKSRIVYMPREWWVDLTWHKMTTYPEIGDWRDDLVFRRDDGMHINYTDVQKIWDDVLDAYFAARETKPEKWRLRSNRHLTASMMFRAGQNLQYVQELLGHSDATMTLYYTHFSAQAKKDAITAYDDALEKGDWGRLAKINEENPVSE